MKAYIFSIFLGIIFFQLSAQEQNIIDKELSDCMEKDPSTQGVIQCADAAYNKWDKELNTYYKLLQENLKPEEKELLKKSQIAWLKFRDTELQFLAKVYENMQGTMYLTIYALDRVEIVKKRVNELKSLYETVKEE
jgi:uncharacterized protein YecT (DUF1311 family)